LGLSFRVKGGSEEEEQPVKQRLESVVDYAHGLPDEVLRNILQRVGMSKPLVVCALVHPVWWKVARQLPGYLIDTLTGHSTKVSCLAIHNDRLYSGSSGDIIKVWSLSDHSEIDTLEGKRPDVTCLAIHNDRLYSGSSDTTIKVWSLSDHSEIDTLRGHRGYVLCLAIHNDRLYSGSSDDTIKVWSLSDHNEIGTLEGVVGVSGLAFHNDRLYSGSRETIKVWSL
jgi:WD40 repeat protein